MNNITVHHTEGIYVVKRHTDVYFVTSEIGAAQVVADRLAGSKEFVTHTFDHNSTGSDKR